MNAAAAGFTNPFVVLGLAARTYHPQQESFLLSGGAIHDATPTGCDHRPQLPHTARSDVTSYVVTDYVL
jgi:hypothetical protein